MKSIRWLLRAIPYSIGFCTALLSLVFAVGTFEETLTVRGTVRVDHYQMVRVEERGLLATMHVGPGDWVEPGELLFSLENATATARLEELHRETRVAQKASRDLRSQIRDLRDLLHPAEIRAENHEIERQRWRIERSSVRVEETRAVLASAEIQLKRFLELFDKGLISDVELEEVRSRRTEAAARLRQSELEEQEARAEKSLLESSVDLLKARHVHDLRDLERMAAHRDLELENLRTETARNQQFHGTLSPHAEMEGIVVGPPRLEIVGKMIEAGEEVLTIIDPHSVVFEAKVDEKLLVRIQPRQKVAVEILGLPKQQFEVFSGEVQSLMARKEDTPNTVEHRVEVHLDKPWVEWQGETFYLRPGMKGRAEIVSRSNMPLVQRLIGAF